MSVDVEFVSGETFEEWSRRAELRMLALWQHRLLRSFKRSGKALWWKDHHVGL